VRLAGGVGLVPKEEAVRRQVQDARRALLLEPGFQGVALHPRLNAQ
jgi:hypothetical protein